jgi:hypothetical protein
MCLTCEVSGDLVSSRSCQVSIDLSHLIGDTPGAWRSLGSGRIIGALADEVPADVGTFGTVITVCSVSSTARRRTCRRTEVTATGACAVGAHRG